MQQRHSNSPSSLKKSPCGCSKHASLTLNNRTMRESVQLRRLAFAICCSAARIKEKGSGGIIRIAIGIVFFQIHIPVRQRVEMDRAEERLIGLDQQNRF